MRERPIPDYSSFFSDKAIELVEWSKSVISRVKAWKIYRAACKVEYYYRKHNIGITSRDFHRWSGSGMTKLATPFSIIGIKRKMFSSKGDA